MRAQDFQESSALWAYCATILILICTHLASWKYDKIVYPASFATLLLVTLMIIGRIVEVSFTNFHEESGLNSLFLGIYSFLPVVYLFAFMLFSRSAALAYSVATWITVLVIVSIANVDALSAPVWPEGLDYLMLVLGICQPIFIISIYKVPPYAEAVTTAMGETEAVKDALNTMEQLSLTDKLTGLNNRRFLDDYWEEFLDEAKYSQQYLSLFIVDIDHFKEFNDSAGHVEGDACLQQISEVLRKFADDFGGHAVRYGGEEFLLIIPSEIDLDSMSLAEQIRYSVRDLKIPHPAKRQTTVSVCVGAARGLSRQGTSQSKWMRAADAALYEAKNAGRNCSIVRDLSNN